MRPAGSIGSPGLAAELVELAMDALVTAPSGSAIAARQVTRTAAEVKGPARADQVIE